MVGIQVWYFLLYFSLHIPKLDATTIYNFTILGRFKSISTRYWACSYFSSKRHMVELLKKPIHNSREKSWSVQTVNAKCGMSMPPAFSGLAASSPRPGPRTAPAASGARTRARLPCEPSLPRSSSCPCPPARRSGCRLQEEIFLHDESCFAWFQPL